MARQQDPRLASQYYSEAQLLAIGRIAELSALLEARLRTVLAQVMGIGTAASEALFLGDRASTLIARIKEVGKFSDAPDWFASEAIEWAKQVGKVIEIRDDILHRPPTMLLASEEEPEKARVGWDRARRSHSAMPIDMGRLLNTIERMAELESHSAWRLFWGKWEEPIMKPDQYKSE